MFKEPGEEEGNRIGNQAFGTENGELDPQHMQEECLSMLNVLH